MRAGWPKRSVNGWKLAGRARRAYRHYRACQHDTKLRDTAVAENDEELAAHYQTVRELWHQVFGEETM